MNSNALTLIVAAIALGVAAYIGKKGFSFLSSVENPVYQGTNSIVQAITGEEHVTLGTKLFEWFNPSAVAREREMLSNPTVPALTDTADYLTYGYAPSQVAPYFAP